MHDATILEYCWLHRAKNIRTTVEKYPQYDKKGAVINHQSQLTLFPPSGSLELLPADVLGPVSRTRKDNQYVVVIADRYSILAGVIYTIRTSTSYVATMLFDNWITIYGILSSLLTDNGPQLVAKLFDKLCYDLNKKHLATTKYYPQPNNQVKQYNEILVAGLCQYISDHQKHRQQYVRPRTNAFNTQVNSSTETTFLSLFLSRPTAGCKFKKIKYAEKTNSNRKVYNSAN